MNIFICDDEALFSERLEEHITRYFNDREVNVAVFETAEALYEKTAELTPDLLFLDIKMPTSDGIEIAKAFRVRNFDFAIVFVTAFEDRAVDGYGVNAFDFIVKPTSFERVSEVLERFEKTKPKYFTAVLKDGSVEIIKHSDILYAEVNGRDTVLHTQDKISELREPIKNIIPLLSDMIEIYKGLYVNVREITRVGKDTLEISSGQTLPVSRRNRKNVISKLMKTVKNG